MLRYLTLILISFMISSQQNQNYEANTSLSELQLSIANYKVKGDEIILELKLENNGDSTLSILKPRPVRHYSFAPAIVPPDFFDIKFANQENKCIATIPSSYNTRDIKSLHDILEVPPQGNVTFEINCANYRLFYCNEERLEIIIVYTFDLRLLEREYFDRMISRKGALSLSQSSELFNAITNTYKKQLVAKATILGSPEIKPITLDSNGYYILRSDSIVTFDPDNYDEILKITSYKINPSTQDTIQIETVVKSDK